MFHVPEQYRIVEAKVRSIAGVWQASEDRVKQMCSLPTYGNNGMFLLPREGRNTGYYFLVRASDGMGWEHVSVSIPSEKRCPTWDEMCYIKKLFWDKEDCVVQYHPPEKDYVNLHEHCLHLWRSTELVIPVPESILVG